MDFCNISSGPIRVLLYITAWSKKWGHVFLAAVGVSCAAMVAITTDRGPLVRWRYARAAKGSELPVDFSCQSDENSYHVWLSMEFGWWILLGPFMGFIGVAFANLGGGGRWVLHELDRWFWCKSGRWRYLNVRLVPNLTTFHQFMHGLSQRIML
uniref:Uncharacterized protein n=1 Tax=Oryza brachyantha TaxID=4533 RepID=J3MVU5_ORYBR